MTRMTRPDCAVMCNLINTHTHTHTILGDESIIIGVLSAEGVRDHTCTRIIRVIIFFQVPLANLKKNVNAFEPSGHPLNQGGKL